MIFARRLKILALLGLLAIQATAQTTVTWSGLGAHSEGIADFGDGGNWVGGVAPASGSNLVFGPSAYQNIFLNSAFTAGNITFSGIQDGYYLSGSTLTLNGNVTTTPGSAYWGLFSAPVDLAAGNHVYTANPTAALYHFGPVSGAGGITKEGTDTLYFSQTNTYSGGTVVNAGTIGVGSDSSLGTGTVTLNNGTTLKLAYVGDDILLGNDFVLGANVSFNTSLFFEDSPLASLTLGNGIGSTITAATGVTNVHLNLQGTMPLFLAGNIGNGPSGATTYTFEGGPGSPAYILSGTNTYTGGTVVSAGAAVTFDGSGAVPATGLINVASDGYAGLEQVAGDAAAFVTHFNPATSAGTIGFDGDYTYTGNIDLSTFTANSSEISLGTFTSATLAGTITPPTASGEYRFRSSGVLTLEGVLTGNNSVLSYSFDGRSPGLLVLNPGATNDYTGSTRAVGAGVIFGSDSSLSSGTTLSLEDGGYMGVTDASGLSLADLVNQGVSVNNEGVLGLDSAGILAGDGSPYADSTPVNFGSLTSPVYLGTATGAIISGAITTTNGGADDYYFTGFNGGYLRIETQLTGTKQVHIGLPGVFQSENVNVSSVELQNITNNFSGGILLNSGQLTATDPLSLGGGTLTVDAASNSDGRAYLQTQGTVSNAITLQTGILDIYASGPLTLNGTITGSGALSTSFGSPLTITGNNSYTGGNTFLATPVTVTQNSGLGTGSLSLTEGSKVTFTSSAPTIGSLLRGDSYVYDYDGYIQEDAALIVTGGGNRTLTINQTEVGFFDGSILQDGSTTLAVVKNGPASLSIGGSNYEEINFTYSGGTTINGGKLIADNAGALGTGTITLNGGSLGTLPGISLANPIVFGASGGKLTGNVTFNTPITVGANAAIAPGNSPGTMTFTAGLTLAPAGTLDFEVQSAVGAAGTGYDLVSISGGALDITATSGSPFTIRLLSLNAGGTAGNVADFSSATGYSWMLFEGNAVGGINTFVADKFLIDSSGFTNATGGGVFSLSEGTNLGNPAIFLNFSPVPEPSTWLLMGTGLAALLATARRRRRA